MCKAAAFRPHMCRAWRRPWSKTHKSACTARCGTDPAHFSSLLFNKPGVPKTAFDGIVQGTMKLEQVVRLLKNVAAAKDMFGLAITEHLPWDVLRLKNTLADLPIMK